MARHLNYNRASFTFARWRYWQEQYGVGSNSMSAFYSCVITIIIIIIIIATSDCSIQQSGCHTAINYCTTKHYYSVINFAGGQEALHRHKVGQVVQLLLVIEHRYRVAANRISVQLEIVHSISVARHPYRNNNIYFVVDATPSACHQIDRVIARLHGRLTALRLTVCLSVCLSHFFTSPCVFVCLCFSGYLSVFKSAQSHESFFICICHPYLLLSFMVGFCVLLNAVKFNYLFIIIINSIVHPSPRCQRLGYCSSATTSLVGRDVRWGWWIIVLSRLDQQKPRTSVTPIPARSSSQYDLREGVHRKELTAKTSEIWRTERKRLYCMNAI